MLSPTAMHTSKNLPSPESTSPPSLVNSTSLSHESSSPPLPGTPPPPRGRVRYGDLGQGHVPLHRRGTSNRYENFEDLLREAGYKETRIFTPETDRLRENGPQSSRGSLRGGVSAMVGFISNLVPTAGSTSRSSSQAPTAPNPAPPSRSRSPSYHSSHSASSSSVATNPSTTSDPTPHATPQRKRVIQMVNVHSTPQQSSARSAFGSREPPRTALPSIRHSSQFQRGPTTTRASAYLRHISSVPAMNQHSAAPRHRNRALFSAAPRRRGREPDPPLPKSWLEGVARAVLLGGGGSLPEATPNSEWRRERDHSAHSMHVHKSRQLSHNNSSQAIVPPIFLTSVASSKSRRTEGVVSRTRVVCRSAPASRNGSRIRPSREENHSLVPRRRSIKGKDRQEQRGRAPRKGETFMPSLSRTKAEGDEWLRRYSEGPAALATPQTPWSALDSSTLSGTESAVLSDSSSSSSDEEGELDLARMLVPPRRQNSIRSLRQHLGPGEERFTPASHVAALSILAGVPNRSGERHERESLLRPDRDDDADQEDYFTFWTGSSNARRTQNKRKALPSSWSRA